VSHSGLTPVASEASDDDLDGQYSESDDSDLGVGGAHKDSAYWSLPENIRHAIDVSSRKKK